MKLRNMVPLHVFGLLLFSYMAQQLVSAGGKCPTVVHCGDVGNVTFPFTTTAHPECGMLVIHGCEDETGTKKSIQNMNNWFEVVNLDQYSFTIRDDGLLSVLLSGTCAVLHYSYTTPAFKVNSPFVSSYLMHYAYLLRCSHNLDPPPSKILSDSTVCETENDVFYGIQPGYTELSDLAAALNSSTYNNLEECSIFQLPLSVPIVSIDPKQLVNSTTADIPIYVASSQNCSDCHSLRGGLCKLDDRGIFLCDTGKTSKIVKIVIVAASIAGGLGILIILAWCFRRRFIDKENPIHQIIEAFLKTHGHLAAKRYNYLEIKKATNSFKYKLGQGGYGTVYKGKLLDGTLVAVKVLSKSKGNGEEFINEVATISMTSHVNIVQLLGFCLEGSRRALIYKYMPNGSVEKFIYEDKDPLMLNLQLSCKTMYNIAIGVARGLEYLHKGCNTKIVHFDIKPHNILLDEDFIPKISDFGLAKICTRKESIVSLLGARGTVGYIAPEVFSRNFGGVSHKSDVYSYGMMVLEMIGGRKNVNVDDEAAGAGVESSSEIYFPHWIYKRLELNQEPGLRCIKNEMDEEMVRKMILVSLWCIQTDPSNRPTMSKVVDMMEQKLELLQIPPKPYLYSSPPRSPPSRSSNQLTQTSQASYPSRYSSLTVRLQ